MELDDIQREHGSDDLCLKAVVEKFLRGESHVYPHPSWQAVIWALDEMDEIRLADKIIDYGEPVQGECTLYMVVHVDQRWAIYSTEALKYKIMLLGNIISHKFEKQVTFNYSK